MKMKYLVISLICTLVVFIVASFKTQMINIYVIPLVFVGSYGILTDGPDKRYLRASRIVILMCLAGWPILLIEDIYEKLTGLSFEATVLRPEFLRVLLHWSNH